MLNKTYAPPKDFSKFAHVDSDRYLAMYQSSINDPETFWTEQARRLLWRHDFTRAKNTTFKDDVFIRWFEGGQLNVAENCIDRHLKQKAQQVAFYWEPDSPTDSGEVITYQTLFEQVNRWSNLLTQEGVQAGDRVTIYLPMIPSAVYAMLACARIGATHSVVFAGFSTEALRDRIVSCDSQFIITADQGRRGGKLVDLKPSVDQAIAQVSQIKKVFVVEHTGSFVDQIRNSSSENGPKAHNETEPRAFGDTPLGNKEVWVTSLLQRMPIDFEAKPFDAEHPLFVLFTSGSTNKPKGVLHSSAGYLLYASLTFETIFDYHPEQVYWCAADVGWVTGHSYMIYGPLACGATSVLFEGVPTWPTPSRIWQIVDKYKVNTLYTAPTLIRSLMSAGDEAVTSTSRKSLRLLGSVGEPINPEAWHWYHEVVGEGRCPIVDTWWQTETGGILLSPLPGATTLKPGSATKPFFGIEPLLMSEEGQEIVGPGTGLLCFKNSWPGQARSLYQDHQRFRETYFSRFEGLYFSGDACTRDQDGDYWIIGRVDDVINVSGHRLGTAEIESALVSHPAVAEAAVVGYSHPVKGQGIYAFVTLMQGQASGPELRQALFDQVKQEIGSFAKPDILQWAPQLPKTRSGKIMRRILRKIAEHKEAELGDTSTLADPSVIEELILHRQENHL